MGDPNQEGQDVPCYVLSESEGTTTDGLFLADMYSINFNWQSAEKQRKKYILLLLIDLSNYPSRFRLLFWKFLNSSALGIVYCIIVERIACTIFNFNII